MAGAGGAGAEIGAGEDAHGEDDAGEKGGVGLGDVGFDGEDQRTGEKAGAEQGGLTTDQRRRQLEGGENGDERAKGGGDAVGPDRVAAGDAEGLGGGHERGLQPVDADGLAIAGLEAVLDADEIAGLQHLLGGLGEAAFVTVAGRQGIEAR